ncbi:hypothetical protein F4808DRAFT_473476 [Astrocystis sublimbata]|nr:hypothetical protein F4808DRAFT_473476 [Astrocystis sublimbata]
MIIPRNYLLYGLALLQATVSGSPVDFGSIPAFFQRAPASPRALSSFNITSTLGPKLSAGSTILFPSNPQFSNLTSRWNTLEPPHIEVVVQPAQESDVATIVKYCHRNSLPFMAVNTGHGFTLTLGKFKGLQIDLKQLRGATIADDKKTALLQGGTFNGEVVPALWDAGYVTSQHGLVLDNMVHLNVVLADGRAIGVNATSHPDLFWAMRGAGHNFGVVTSAVLNIYPADTSTWHYHNYVWSSDKLETVFETLNKIQNHGQAPPKLGVSYGMIHLNSSISTTKPVLFWTFGYSGPADEAEAVLAPFNAIQAITQEMGDVPYPDIVGPQLTSQDTDCGDGAYAVTTTMTKTWNVTAERRNFELYRQNIALYPDLAPTSLLFYEGYAVKAVQAVPSASTAYPHRDQNHLCLFQVTVTEDSNSKASAQAWAKDHWDIWAAGHPGSAPAVYVNYAVGLEYQSLEDIYGSEPWRLQKLRKVKAEYDPGNSFRYYNSFVR